MKKNWFLIGSVILGFIAFFWILQAVPIKDVLLSFMFSDLKTIIGYIIVSAALMVTQTWRWKVVLKTQKISIPFRKLVAYRIAGYGISYLTPSAKLGGEPIRAALLSKHNLTFSKALSSVLIDKSIDLATCAILFFLGALTVLFHFALPQGTEIILLVFAVLFLTIMILFYQSMASGKGFIQVFLKRLKIDKIKWINYSEKKVANFEKLMIKFFKDDKTDFLITMLISGLTWILMFLEFKLAGLLLGYNFSFLTIFFIASFVGAAIIVPVPMAIGVLEASQMIAFSLSNLKPAAGLALSFLIRFKDLVWSFIGLMILSIYGFNIGETIKKMYKNNSTK